MSFQGILWTKMPDGPSLGIGRLPGRKRIALYGIIGSNIHVPYAYFRDEEAAEGAVEALSALIPSINEKDARDHRPEGE